MTPLISIQILNWNRAEETQRAIKSALNQTYPNIEVVLVDNGSNDNSLELTKKNFPNINIVELDRNYGCAGGRNLGIPHCKGDYIFYLDNDGVLHKEAVKNAFNSITSNPNIGIVTGIVYDFEDTSEIDTACLIKNHITYKSNLFQGGISLHDKKIYEKTGYYPDHFIYGQEETFLSLKLFDTDYIIIKDESVILWHKKSMMARNKTRETLLSYYNKLYIAISTYPLKPAIIFFIYFLLKYPIFAYKQNVFKDFIISFPNKFTNTMILALRNRKPISADGLLKFATYKR